MTTPTQNSRNDIGRWIVLGLICAGGSTGGGLLRKHNPEITTEAWIKMTVTVERLDRELAALSGDVRQVLRLLPQPPQTPP